MVSTRTQTGTIATKHYDILTLQLNSTISPPTSPVTSKAKRSPKAKPTTKPRSPIQKRHSISRQPNSPTISSKPSPKTKRSSTPPGFNPRDKKFEEQMMLNYLPTQMVDICDGINFFPSRCWGEKETVGLSAIQRAERDVEIWEEVKRSHAEGGLENMVPVIEAVIENEREKMANLKREERAGRKELGRAGVKDPGQVAIKERLEALEWALSTSKYDLEAENIRGAIAAYKSGALKFAKHFTLIYAGKVVDTAPTYGSFVSDRQERLNRYAALHGEHWLWYEPPLDVHPEERPKMLASLALARSDDWTHMGQWKIVQGFWKRANWVSRMPQSTHQIASRFEPKFWKAADGTVFCQEAGPKQAFRSVLDSGATFPTLYKDDMRKLMIDEENYAAQSVTKSLTANGEIYSRMFELFVCVLTDDQKQLVDENHCAWPYHAKYLGGLCPVVEMGGAPNYDANGIEMSIRLSGMLPFVACYISSTPTRSMIYLGEDRKDVLGSHRMPGQRKWDIAMPVGPPIPEVTWDRYQDPKTTFVHRGGKIVDEDDPNIDYASTVTFMKGTAEEYSHRIYPKEEIEVQRANMAKKKAVSDATYSKWATGTPKAAVSPVGETRQAASSWMNPGQPGGQLFQTITPGDPAGPDPEDLARTVPEAMDVDGGIKRQSRGRRVKLKG